MSDSSSGRPGSFGSVVGAAVGGGANGGVGAALARAGTAAESEFQFNATDRSISRDRADLARYAARKGVNRPGTAFAQRLSGGPLPCPQRGPSGRPVAQTAALADWRRRNITRVDIPQLRGRRYTARCDPFLTGTHLPAENDTWQRDQVARRVGTSVDFHSRGARQLTALWNAWDRAGVLRFVIFEIGFLFQRYMMSRSATSSLSNHAYGTAFDINSIPNAYNRTPAARDAWGTVVPLVPLAIDHGFYWGGFYDDGMHFELAKII